MRNSINKIMNPYLGKKIILSVSGGVDSLVLFHILKELHFELVVVHFNHQKRISSIKEALYLDELMKKENIVYEYFVLDIPQENFQNEAHLLRKKLLIETAQKYNTNVIVTAHHLNDLAESILMKLSRGSNLLGYAGIRKDYYKYKMHFVKPLLDTTKQEILRYAIEQNITYFEDESNQSDSYTRNRYRHHIVPNLIEENASFLDKIKQYNVTLTESFDYIRKQTIKFLNGKKSFLIPDFNELDIALKRDIIAYLLELQKLEQSFEKINSILDFIDSSGPNASYDIGNNYVLQKTYNKLTLELVKVKSEVFHILDLKSYNVLSDNTSISFTKEITENTNYEIKLCYNILMLPLIARTRKDGDTIYFPFGHKKLKDFYIDKKIPLKLRDSDIIITDSSNQVLAVLGRYYNQNPENKDTIYMKFNKG
ncbi:MAG: tRNA lysidine(34) synthetase TilS [Acholeplasmataceae bacterium]|nr:tRNA lysidine(34) synthetase TilS [Acholeplasmataceae bacterium]